MRVEAHGMAADLPVRGDAQVKPLSRPTPVKDNTGNINRVNSKISAEDLAKKATPDPEALNQAIHITNEAMKISNHRLEFTLHEDSGRYQVKVIDANTKEVVREIPPEYMLDFSAKVQELLDNAVGIFVDEIA